MNPATRRADASTHIQGMYAPLQRSGRIVLGCVDERQRLRGMLPDATAQLAALHKQLGVVSDPSQPVSAIEIRFPGAVEGAALLHAAYAFAVGEGETLRNFGDDLGEVLVGISKIIIQRNPGILATLHSDDAHEAGTELDLSTDWGCKHNLAGRLILQLGAEDAGTIKRSDDILRKVLPGAVASHDASVSALKSLSATYGNTAGPLVSKKQAVSAGIPVLNVQGDHLNNHDTCCVINLVPGEGSDPNKSPACYDSNIAETAGLLLRTFPEAGYDPNLLTALAIRLTVATVRGLEGDEPGSLQIIVRQSANDVWYA